MAPGRGPSPSLIASGEWSGTRLFQSTTPLGVRGSYLQYFLQAARQHRIAGKVTAGPDHGASQNTTTERW